MIFTPANLAQYTVADNSVFINVAKANPTITFAEAMAIQSTSPTVSLATI